MNHLLSLLKNEEKAVFALRSLYGKYGYLPYKMSKFEEYELYVRNKDFLVSDSVITFNDTNGRLLALKPDVTLSIVKNYVDEPGVTQKLFYNENVYRVSARTHTYKEIMQTGLECIGDIDLYDISEVVNLSLESLGEIGGEFVLDLSHLGVLSALLDETGADESLKKQIMHCISEKNRHELALICEENAIDAGLTEMLVDFVSVYGTPEAVIETLRKMCINETMKEAIDELESICGLLKNSRYSDKINLDFSIVNDMNYYNGIVFKGFINGIPESVLSGGQYDKLMKKMGKRAKAIGFAVYLDLLEQTGEKKQTDVDTLVLYSEKSDMGKLSQFVADRINSGESVSAQRKIPQKLRYKTLIDFDKEENAQ